MIDITSKFETLRMARAEAYLKVSPATLQAIQERTVPKGDVCEVARVAGILASKRTSDALPFCHPLAIQSAEVTVERLDASLRLTATIKAVAATGVEMEALHAVSVAALTAYDMLKPIDKGLAIERIALIEKRGGKSDYARAFPKGLRAGVLVVSDSTAQGTRMDKSGRAIVERLEAIGISAETVVVADDVEKITAALRKFEQANCDLLLTTGGTGLGPRDVTVEATRGFIDREATGIVEALRGHGQRRTPYAMLSRAMAGVRGRMLIVNLPGSTRGVSEGLDVLLPAVLHAFPIMDGAGHTS